jgi:hypothetical protein
MQYGEESRRRMTPQSGDKVSGIDGSGIPGSLLSVLAHICLPGEIVVQVNGLGSLVLRPTILGSRITKTHAESARSCCEVLTLECGEGFGWLLVERRLALQLVHTLLGVNAPTVSRPLSRIERGLLEGVLALLSARLGYSPALHLCTEATQSPISPIMAGAMTLEILIEFHGQVFHAWLCVNDLFITEAWTTWQGTSGQASTTFRLELARTRIPAADLAMAEECDWVVFEETAPLSPSDPWPVEIRRGRFVIPAHLHPNGSLQIKDIDFDDLEDDTDTKPERFAIHSNVGNEVKCRTSGAGPFEEIVAEIGDYQLSGNELAGLLSEGRLKMGRNNLVNLRRQETPWAEGKLTEIDGEFAVRITRKLGD